MPKIVIKRGNLMEHDTWNRHKLAYNMGLWDFSYAYAVNTMDIDQTIDGVKTFVNFPVTPMGFPVEDREVANKFYVDSKITFESLLANGDVGANADQVAGGDHSHSGIPSEDQKDAMDTAQSPAAANPFITWSVFETHASRHTTVGQDKIADSTITTPGLMSASDKVKLDGLSSNIFESQATMYTHMGAVSVAATLANTPYVIDGLTEGYKVSDTTLMQVSGTNGKFTVGTSGAGVYFLNYNISMETNKACTLHFHIFVNGVEKDPGSFERKIANANDVGSGSAHTILDLSSGDYIEVKLESSAVNTAVTVNHMNFSIMRTIQ